MAQICFNETNFYLTMFIGIAIILYVTMNNKPIKKIKIYTPPTINYPEDTSYVQQSDDIQRMFNPLVAPMRRGEGKYILPPSIYRGRSFDTSIYVPTSIPTRGEHGPFQQIGYLYNTNDPKEAMPLMGRRIHSNQYEYYTLHHKNTNIKIPISVKGNREIDVNEPLTVTGYPDAFSIKIYDLDVPRYLP